MDKTVPILRHLMPSSISSYTIKMLALVLGIITLLSACSTSPQKQPSQPASTEQTSPPLPATATQPTKALETEAHQALRSGDYPTYLKIAQILWQKTQDPSDHAAINYQLWRSFQKLTTDQLTALHRLAIKTHDTALEDWSQLGLTWRQHQGIYRIQAMQDAIAFSHTPNQFDYLNLLIPTEVKRTPYLHQIAVFLPLSGKYRQVSLQIRNGMMKHLFAQQKDWQLKFYDTHQNRNLPSLYQQALEEGADRILGPLTKRNIQQLQSLNTDKILALNRIQTPTIFPQYGYLPLSETSQIEDMLCRQNYRHLGILTSQANGDLRLAHALTHQWRQIPLHHAALNHYPTRHPNLRKALGGLINENQSQARKANLQWLLKEKLTFRPRLRQDLQAIVIVGNRQRTAVFKPQFKFFDLKLPIYGTSKLTPEKLQYSPAIKDLSQVIFPTMPAALTPHPLVKTPFEAFGWDSLTLLERQHLYAPQLCDHTGLTGAFEKTEENFIDRWLTWAIYDKKGRPKPWQPK